MMGFVVGTVRRAVMVAALVSLSACGTIYNARTAHVTVTATAPGEILVDGVPTGATTPGVVRVHNQQEHQIMVRTADGAAGTCELKPSVWAGFIWLNFLGAYVGLAVDGITGAWKSVDDRCAVRIETTTAPGAQESSSPPITKRSKRYGIVIAGLDALSVGLVAGAVAVADESEAGAVGAAALFTMGLVNYLGGAPSIHHRYGNNRRAWLSHVVRMIGAMFLAPAAFSRDDSDLYLGLVPVAAGMLLDWLVLARKDVLVR